MRSPTPDQNPPAASRRSAPDDAGGAGLDEQLDGIGSRWRKAAFSARALRTAAGAAAWVLLLHAADCLFPLPVYARAFLLAASLGLAVAGLAYLLSPLVSRLPPGRAARLAESRLPALRQEVTTAWEWAGRGAGPGREGYSSEVIAALARRAATQLRAADPALLFPADRRLKKVAAAAVTAAALAALLWPGESALTLRRFARPDGVHGEWPEGAVKPGSLRVARGSSVMVTAPWPGFTVRWRDSAGASGRVSARSGSAELTAIETSTVYRVLRGRWQSPAYRIGAYRPLELHDIRIRLEPPRYSRLAVTEQENQYDICGLRGTVATLTARASQPLQRAGLSFEDGREVAGETGQGGLVAISVELRRSSGYRLWARSVSGETLAAPAMHAIRVIDDAAPTAELDAPEPDAALGPELGTTVAGRASDDFGLTGVVLAYRAGGGAASIPLLRLPAPTAEAAVSYRWDLAGLSLLPGDSVVYWLEARDNDAVSGPKIGRSGRQVLRLPTFEDLYRGWEAADSAMLSGVAQPESAGRDLRRELERLSQAVKESRSVEWQHRAALEQAVSQQQELLGEMQRAADQALASLRDDPGRFAFDAETVLKMEELRRLFEQTATEEMRRQMEQLRQAVERADRRQVERALEDLKLGQDELKQRLDAAIAGLKQLQQQRQLELLGKQADQLLREQREVRDQTGRAETEAQRQRLRQRQEQLARDTDFLAGKLQERADELDATEPDLARPLRDAAGLLRDRQTAATMRRAAEQVGKGSDGPARESQQRAVDDLSQVSASAGQAAGAASGRKRQAEAKAMRQKAARAVRLSQQQEALNQRLERMREGRNDLADDQQTVERAAARLQQELERAASGGQSAPPQAGAAMRRALQHMRAAGQGAAEGGGQRAAGEGRSAQAALNQAAMAMMAAAGQPGGAPGPGDMAGELEGLSSRQQRLNQNARSAADQEAEMGLQAIQSQIPRLAAEQAAIRQGLQEFNQRYADRSDRVGRTDDLVREMERVIEELSAGRVSRETVRRQERILTRMLDAQRSLQERDLSRQRQAESGRDHPGRIPTGGAAGSGQPWRQHEHWRDWRSQPYPLEYRPVLEQYFRLLGQ